MGQIKLDNETKFSFLYNDCGIMLPVVEKFIFENMWDDSLTFLDNADNCREMESKMIDLNCFKVTIDFGQESKKKPIIKEYNSLEEAFLYMKHDIEKRFGDVPIIIYHYERHFNGLLLFSEITYSERDKIYTIRNFSGKDNVISPEYKREKLSDAFYLSQSFVHKWFDYFKNSYITNITYGQYWHDMFNHEKDYQIKIEYTSKN